MPQPRYILYEDAVVTFGDIEFAKIDKRTQEWMDVEHFYDAFEAMSIETLTEYAADQGFFLTKD